MAGLLPSPAELAGRVADSELARRGVVKSAGAREVLVRRFLPWAEAVTTGFAPLAEGVERFSESVNRLYDADTAQKAAAAVRVADLAGRREAPRPADDLAAMRAHIEVLAAMAAGQVPGGPGTEAAG